MEHKLESARKEVAILKEEVLEQAKKIHDDLPYPAGRVLALWERTLKEKEKEINTLNNNISSLEDKSWLQREGINKELDIAHKATEDARKETEKLQDEAGVYVMRHAEGIATISDDLEKSIAVQDNQQ